jgi:carnitine-CoA ligase
MTNDTGNRGKGASMATRPRVGLEPTQLAPHAVARWARERPDAIAVQHIDGDTYTYGQLDAEVRRWAGALARLGVDFGTHVATMLPNGAHAHFALMGIGWLRGIEVPINTALTGRLLHYMLHNSDTEVLLIAGAYVERVLALDEPLPELTTIVVVDSDDVPARSQRRMIGRSEFLDGVEPGLEFAGPLYRDIAAILYTSGTTGPSKGVLVPWAILYGFWSYVPEGTVVAGEGLHCSLPVVHNSGRSTLNYAMEQGVRFVCRERFSGSEFWNDVRRYNCATASLVGPMTQFLYSQPRRTDDADNPLRSIVCGPLISEIEDFKRRFGVTVATCYGMTETGIILTTSWDHGPWQNCGRPRTDYPYAEVRVVNEFDEPLGPGEVGELVVRSPEPWSMNAGYYKMPDKTAEAWRNGWFHTGDAFRYDDDGWYYLVDRMKDAIRRRGENISSFEVETIVRDFPGVDDCAAIAVPAELGEDEVLVVIQTSDPQSFDPAALLTWLEPRMPKYMIPRYVDVVTALPRNETTQRVKKYELRERGVTATTFDREASA